MRPPLKAVRTFAVALLFGVLGVYLSSVVWSSDKMSRVAPSHPAVVLTPRLGITFPGKHLTLKVAEFNNDLEVSATMVRLRATAQPGTAPMAAVAHADGPAFVSLELPTNLIAAVPVVARLRIDGVVTSADWTVTQPEHVREWRDQTVLFDRLYSDLPSYTRSAVSPRLVGDIVALAGFYELPLRLFKPAAGRENPPPPAAIWKPNPGSEDAILLRAPGSTLVVDRDLVAWREVRDALLHAHGLFESDGRDYDGLPVGLVPPRLFADDVPPGALLTYAAILLRDLVDKAGGDDPENLSAYTIRPDNPNVRHDPGVRRAALYARRVLAHAVEVNRLKIAAELRSGTPVRR